MDKKRTLSLKNKQTKLDFTSSAWRKSSPGADASKNSLSKMQQQTTMTTFFGKNEPSSERKVACVPPMSIHKEPTSSSMFSAASKPVKSASCSKNNMSMFADYCIDDDDDFDLLFPVATPNKKPKDRKKDEILASDSEEEIIIRAPKKRTSILISDDDSNDIESASQDSMVPGQSLATAATKSARITSSPVKSEPPEPLRDFDADGQHEIFEDDDCLLDIPTPSPPPAELDLQRLAELETQAFLNRTSDEDTQDMTDDQELPDRMCEGSVPSELDPPLKGVHGEMYSVMTDICDIVGGISLDDLLSLTSINHSRLQHLLAQRKQLKRKLEADDPVQSSTSKTCLNVPSMVNSKPAAASRLSTAGPSFRSPSPSLALCPPEITRVIDQKGVRTPVTNSSSTSFTDNQSPVISRFVGAQKSTKRDSISSDPGFLPPPCGDSFFDESQLLPSTLATFKELNSPTVHQPAPTTTIEPKKFSFKKPGAQPSALVSSPNLAASFKRPGVQPSASVSSPNLAASRFVPSVSRSMSPSDSLPDLDTGPKYNSPQPQASTFNFPYKISEQTLPKKTPAIGFNDKSSVTNDNNSAFPAFPDDDSFNWDDVPADIEYSLISPKRNNPPRSSLISQSSTSLSNSSMIQPHSTSHNTSAFNTSLTRKSFGGTNAPSTPGMPSTQRPSFIGNQLQNISHEEFEGHNFPHSAELKKAFSKVFGLKQFRKNQLQAINAALLGHDCFILMPTGGGKSLCYQLPAIVAPGVTIVISPLRSLIYDQTQKLNSLNVAAYALSGDVKGTDESAIYNKLYLRDPAIKLLYVTPEKICASGRLGGLLENLYNRKLLSRFIIDEAHCVSQWGHDFRPDYKKLNTLRNKYPGVPIMAATATANPRVREDILLQLSMKKPKWFVQSFNRPNLKYEVAVKKPKGLAKIIIERIHKDFRNMSGIVYCLSRKECDQVAAELARSRIAAVSYHAGLTDKQRTTIQERWINEDRCKVVCATIAFGMGIDKPDVRFVMHYCLPKSIEGYYQESGRAGRDDRYSVCILYYSYSDVTRIRKMIEMDQNANYEGKRVHLHNLYRMVQYCENKINCRRAQQLEYFGERFDASRCSQMPRAICDTCSSEEKYTSEDLTDIAKIIVQCVSEILRSRNRRSAGFTLLHFIEVFKGSQNNKVMESGHNNCKMYALGKKYHRTDVERLFRQLVVDAILDEEIHVTSHEHAVCYVKLGRKANDVLGGRMRVNFQTRSGKSKIAATQNEAEKKSPRAQVEQDCYEELVSVVKEMGKLNSSNYSLIFPEQLLRDMAHYRPVTLDEILSNQVSHATIYKLDKHKTEFIKLLDVTMKYTAIWATMDDGGMTDTDAFEEDIFDSDNEESSYFNHEPSTSFSGRRGGGLGKGRWKRKRKGSGAPRAKRQKAATQDNKSSRGKSNFSKYSSTRKPAMGRATSTVTSGASTARKPGILGAPKSTRSFLGGGMMYM